MVNALQKRIRDLFRRNESRILIPHPPKSNTQSRSLARARARTQQPISSQCGPRHSTYTVRILHHTYVLVLLARQTPEPCFGTSRGFSDNRCKIRTDAPARPRKTRSSREETAGRPGELCRNRNGTGSNLHEIVRFHRNARTKPQLMRARARAFHATMSVSLLVD